MSPDLTQLLALPDGSKLELIGILWDGMQDAAANVPNKAAFHDEWARRIAAIERDPADALTEDELWAEVDRRRG